MHDWRERVHRTAAESDFSGVVRVDRLGAVELDAAYGLADRAHGIPMTTTTRLGMASGSKTFTALVVLKLIERGLLSLMTTARDLLGTDLPLIADDVTIGHLLCHRSGIGDYLDEDVLDSEDYPMPVSVHRLATTEDFVPILDGYPTKFPAGTAFSYCNGGYVVLALLAERVSGRTYQDLVREVVCEPAGMTATGFPRSDALPGDCALGYVQVGDEWRTNVFHLPVVGSGDGGAYTTTADLVRFWQALMAGRIIRPDLVRQMVTPHNPPDEDGDAYGFGCWVRHDSPVVTMSGGDAGVSLWSCHDPRGQMTASVIGNTVGATGPVREAIVAGLGE